MARKVGQLVISVLGDIDPLSKALNKAGRKIDRFGKRIEDIGFQFSKISVPLSAGILKSVSQFATFERAMLNVKAKGDLAEQSFKTLSEQAKELGASTKFTATQAADAMGVLATAGFEAVQINKAVPSVLKLASATGIDLAESASILANTMGQFNLEATDSQRIIDTLSKASVLGNTNISEMSEALKKAGGIANQSGVSLEQLSATLAFLANQGIKGSEAGTALRAGLAKLQKPAGEAATLMKRLGIEVKESTGELKPLNEIIEQFRTKIGDNDLPQAITTVFGTEALTAWLAIVKDGNKELDVLTQKVEKAQGTANKMSAELEQGVTDAFNKFVSAVESAYISIGEQFAPAIIDLLQQASDFARWIADLAKEFSKLPDPIKETAIQLSLVLATAGPLALALGATTRAVGALSKGLALLTTAGLAPFVGAAVRVIPTTLLLRSSIGALINTLAAVPLVGPTVVAALTYIGTQIDGLVRNWDDVSIAIQAIWNTLIKGVNSFAEGLYGTFSRWTGSIADTIDRLGKAIGIDFLGTIKAAAKEIGGILDWLYEKTSEIYRIFSETTARRITGLAQVIAGEELARLQAERTQSQAVIKQLDAAQAKFGKIREENDREIKEMAAWLAQQDAERDRKGTSPDPTTVDRSVFTKLSSESKAQEVEAKRLATQRERIVESYLKQVGLAKELTEEETRRAQLLAQHQLSGNILGATEVIAKFGESEEELKSLVRVQEESRRLAATISEEWDDASNAVKNNLAEIFDSLGLQGSWDAANILGDFLSYDAREQAVTLGEQISEAIQKGLGVDTDSGSKILDLLGLDEESVNTALGAFSAIVAQLPKIEAIGDSKTQTGTGIGTILGGVIGGILGASGGPAGAAAGATVGASAGGFLGGLTGGLFESKNFDQAGRNAAGTYIESFLSEAGAQFINAQGALQGFGGDIFIGQADRFADVDYAADAVNRFGAEAFGMFVAVGDAVKELAGVTEDVGGQIGFALAEQLGGSVDNVRYLVQQLGVSQEDALASMFDLARRGEITWLEYNIRVRDVSKAFEEGLEAVGAYGKAFDLLVSSGGRGQAALISLKNIAIEALEAGVTSISQLQAKLIEEGYSVEQVNALISSLSARNIDSLEELQGASNATLGAIVGDMQAASTSLNDQWQSMTSTLQEIQKTIAEIPEKQVKSVQFDVEVNDPSGALNGLSPQLSTQSVTAFANGGVFGKATPFMYSGGLGVMAEKGEEAVLPLKRFGAKLGVIAEMRGGQGGTQVAINIDATGAEAGVEDRIEAAIEVMRDEIINTAVSAAANQAQRGGRYGRSF